MPNPRAICPRPGCEKVVERDVVVDARERRWHRSCAHRALAAYFRTPLDLEALAGERVEFAYEWTKEEQAFRAPHDFFLRAIVFEEDIDVMGLFVGPLNAFSCAPCRDSAVATGDFPNMTLPVGMIAHRVDVMVQPDPCGRPFRCRFVGERLDPKSPPEESYAPAHGGLRAGGVAYLEAASATFIQYGAANFDRIASRDWEDWEVVRVEVGGVPGTAHEEAKKIPLGLRLAGRSTPLPIFAVEPGEPVRFVVRNLRDGPLRDFAARVYGTQARAWA